MKWEVKKIYTYGELSDKAKERAIEDFKENCLDTIIDILKDFDFDRSGNIL